MKTIYLSKDWMEDTPAAIDRHTGILYINPKRYFQLTPFQKEFVKWHEYGHYNLNTDDELKADEYAFNHLAGTQFQSLKQCIECLEQLLDEDKIGHKVRIDHMYDLAVEWDKKHPQVNKATAGSEDAAADDSYINAIIANQTGSIQTINSMFNGLQSMLNTLVIAAVLIVAMVFILKEN